MKGEKGMENIKVTNAEREIPLRFRMNEFAQIEEEVGNLAEVKELVLNGKNRIRNIVSIIRIMGNAGLRHAGEADDLTDDWLMENMNPHELMAYQVAVLGCMTKESESQAQHEKDENEERDLVLEEIQAKKDPVNSPTGA